ncbi:hypothetical protein ACLMJK_008654 [Lecanora helva]
MNVLPAAPSARTHSNAGSIGGASTNTTLTSPTSIKRRRTQDIDSSPGSGDDGCEVSGGRRRQPGVKRACNECRQQKLRCSVITDPVYVPCERCQRLRLTCKIDSNFKRVGKRSKNAEMEREIIDLRRQLASQQSSPTTTQPPIKPSPSAPASPNLSTLPVHIPPLMDQFMGSEEAVAGLMDMRYGQEGASYRRSPKPQISQTRRIGSVMLTYDQVNELFQHYFTFYHPFLLILEPEKTPDYYYETSQLRFWIIISVAARRLYPSILKDLAGPVSELLWKTLAEIPQNYIIVKALCILCTWPLPIDSTSSDPTFMLSGLMMQIAMQIGLHRPSHTQDFTKFKVELMEEELRDRVRTWAACNATAQRVATGYGQPPSTFYDWTLTQASAFEEGFRLPPNSEGRLLIEKFCNKVTKALYSNYADPVGLAKDSERSVLTRFLARDYEYLEQMHQQYDSSPIATLYVRAAGLHFRLHAFFDSPNTKDYAKDLLSLWLATTSFLECALHLESHVGKILIYSTNYILQMIVAAAFALLKLLNSFFANDIDLNYGKKLFTDTIAAIRIISVKVNDLPSRLAEVLAQLWRSSGAGSRKSQDGVEKSDSSLQLKVKCRMSMSLVYDSIWRWREEFQASGRGNLDSAVKNPTNPDSAVESSANSVADHSMAPASMLRDTATPPDGSFADANYEVFDPLGWMLDGLVDFPYSMGGQMPDLGGQDMM